MAYIDRKKLMTSDGKVVTTVLNEIVLTADQIYPLYTNEAFRNAIVNPIISGLYKLVLLYPDESDYMDISSYVVDDTINCSNEHKNGQTRSFSCTLKNPDHVWSPHPISGGVWMSTKARLHLGIVADDNVYWFPKGVFVIESPSYSEADETVSLQFADKFACIDGTLGGKLESEYKIAAGTPLYTALTTLMKLDTGNGTPFDCKPVIFPSRYASAVTPYTLVVNNSNTVGDIALEVANIISCDIFYNEEGYLTLQAADDLLQISKKPVLWAICGDGVECMPPSLSVEFSRIINKVCVVGANINGAIVKHVATNTNPKSPSNISMSPVHFEYISDSNINTYELCKIRAEYELQKKSVVAMTHKFQCVFMPFIEANAVILYNEPNKGIYNQALYVSAVTHQGGVTDISCANIDDLPY